MMLEDVDDDLFCIIDVGYCHVVEIEAEITRLPLMYLLGVAVDLLLLLFALVAWY